MPLINNRLNNALECRASDRVPFVPAIYEHKAWFVHSTPSVVCRDVKLFTEALLAEYESIRPDALTVGVDVYNVEAEAVGCKVRYYGEGDSSVPAIEPDTVLYRGDDDIGRLRMPDTSKDGRMPVNVEVAKNIVQALGKEIPVRGAVSGPFSMAASLVGPENFLMLTITQPALVHEVMAFCAEVIQQYASAFVRIGCGVVIFDSQSSPALISPDMYRDFVLKPTQGLIRSLQTLGVKNVPLIVGGNTTDILESYLETGGNNILCDYPADGGEFLLRCSAARRAFRRNINSSDFITTTPEKLRVRTLGCLDEGKGYPGFILGTAVAPFGTPLEHLLAIKTAVEEYSKKDSV